ncbi:MAG: cell envelope biogenesis protein OmpA [Allomuricauda sp.]|nr:MAG: cell envelope biogenesis protein OmpA [Allomuricauda sp.]
MARNLAYLFGMGMTILIGIYFYCTCCSWCKDAPTETEPLKEKVSAEIEPKATSFPFAVSTDDFSFEVNDNFNFNSSSPSFIMPLSEELKKGVDTLRSYLAQHGDRVINITGYFSTSEENSSAYPDLGIARANSVKNHFVSSGIPSRQINTMGMLKDDMVARESMYHGAVAFEIKERNNDSDVLLKALYDKIKADPLVLYFETGQTAIALTAAQREKIANISRYLDKVDDASCEVIGHTDNTGNRAANIALGQERADFAKAYLIRNGILASKVNSSSAGPDDPIASNTTEEGKAQNRRVVVTLN